MYKIKTIENKDELKELFDFLSKTFYDDAKKYNEHYYTMTERFEEMKKQFDVDKDLLMYIEINNIIIAGITGKGMDLENKKITLGLIAVDACYRRRGIAEKLINEFEKRCKSKGINHIDLGARFRACPLYISLGYKPSLMVQIFDFATLDDIRKANIYNLKETFSWKSDDYGFILFQVDSVKEEYIRCFEDNVPTSHAQFIFKKNL